MNSSYDLTTKSGFEKAVKLFDKLGWLISPLAWLIRQGTKPTVSKQAEAAKKLIIAGKEAGLRSLKIEMEQDAAGKLGTSFKGIPIQAESCKRNKMILTARY